VTLWLAVMVAGAAGACCRYVVDYVVTARSRGDFPWGTLAVNLSGALLLGVVAGAVGAGAAPASVRTVAGAGFCGAYTTFSTLVLESLRLIEDRAYRLVATNLASVLLGAVAAAGGWGVAVALL
jgi:fluoride exporter